VARAERRVVLAPMTPGVERRRDDLLESSGDKGGTWERVRSGLIMDVVTSAALEYFTEALQNKSSGYSLR
jgi:hypothetical protein